MSKVFKVFRVQQVLVFRAHKVLLVNLLVKVFLDHKVYKVFKVQQDLDCRVLKVFKDLDLKDFKVQLVLKDIKVLKVFWVLKVQ
ncbi:MAG: hypothetical protein EBS89_01980 [Proteobacteria bacterium]|nr:hypothetical protein [Pseudomonadota bacterium]